MQSKFPNQTCLLKASAPQPALDRNPNGRDLGQAIPIHLFYCIPDDLGTVYVTFWPLPAMKAFALPLALPDPRTAPGSQHTLNKDLSCADTSLGNRGNDVGRGGKDYILAHKGSGWKLRGGITKRPLAAIKG